MQLNLLSVNVKTIFSDITNDNWRTLGAGSDEQKQDDSFFYWIPIVIAIDTNLIKIKSLIREDEKKPLYKVIFHILWDVLLVHFSNEKYFFRLI